MINYCKELIKKHLPNWSFGYHKHRLSLARTSHRYKKITLHENLRKSKNEYVVRNLIKHEIAHAKSSRAGHGKTWLNETNKLRTADWAKKKKIYVIKEKDGGMSILLNKKVKK